MKKITTFKEHLDKQYGKKGSERRDKFTSDSISFHLGEMLREERTKAKLTQETIVMLKLLAMTQDKCKDAKGIINTFSDLRHELKSNQYPCFRVPINSNAKVQ